MITQHHVEINEALAACLHNGELQRIWDRHLPFLEFPLDQFLGRDIRPEREDLIGIRGIQYRWKRQYVTPLSPESAVLVAEGESTVTTEAGVTFTAPFAQTVVFVLRDGRWRAIHAHQSSPRPQ